MRKIVFGSVLVAVLAGVVAGCSKSGGGSAAAGAAPLCKSLLNPSIKAEEAIVRVNGQPITKAEFDGMVDIRARVYCCSKNLNPLSPAKKVAEYSRSMKDIVLADLVRREVIRQAAEARALVVPEASVRAMERSFMKGVNEPKGDFSAYAAKLPEGEGDILRKMVVSDAQAEYFLEQWATNDFKHVSDAEVSNRLVFVETYNANVEAKNKEAKAKAAAAKAEILAGASFASVTTNRAEIFVEQGTFYDSYELGELDPDEDLFRFLASANQGDISDPLDFDDGIGIVGVLLKEPGAAPDGVVPEMEYTLVRCMFNAYETLDEPEDFKGMKKLLLERKRDEAREAFVLELMKDAKVELPFGKKLFSQPKKKSAKAPRKKAKSKVAPKKAKSKSV